MFETLHNGSNQRAAGNRGRYSVIALAAVLLIAGCGAPPPADPIDAAISSPERPPTDRDRDAGRKPAEVARFFGVSPGMTVLEMFAGGGYYAEVFARIVGTDGKVYCHNNSAHRRFLADAIAARFRDERLPNVVRVDTEAEDIDLPPASVDAALLILAYHDVYVAADENWPEIDHQQMLAAIFEALKPGGVLGVVDHTARPGGDPADVATALHRIDEAVVIRDLERAGFTLEERSGVLRNPSDDYDKRVFDPGVRGRTDRFILRFRKPPTDEA